MPKGQKFEIWPLHITIVPWFHCDDGARLDKTLSSLAGRHKKFRVKAGAIEQWGKKEKYEVQTLDANEPLLVLHHDIFVSLEANGFEVHQKDFLGEKYSPHLALRNRLQRGEALPLGTPININCFTLVKQERLKKSGRMIKALAKDYELK